MTTLIAIAIFVSAALVGLGWRSARRERGLLPTLSEHEAREHGKPLSTAIVEVTPAADRPPPTHV